MLYIIKTYIKTNLYSHVLIILNIEINSRSNTKKSYTIYTVIGGEALYLACVISNPLPCAAIDLPEIISKHRDNIQNRDIIIYSLLKTYLVSIIS